MAGRKGSKTGPHTLRWLIRGRSWLGMVNKHAAFKHHLLQVAMTQWIRRMPANAHHIDVNWQAHSLGRRSRFSSLFSNIAKHRLADGLTANATQASALLDR